jgi:curved DNA-binding protein CbpA
MSTERDAYEVLQVQPKAHAVVVHAAYRALAAIYHPDHDGSNASNRKMAELNDAYAKVRTPERRELYDRVASGEPGRQSPSSRHTLALAQTRPRRRTAAEYSISVATRAGAFCRSLARTPTTCAGSLATHQAYASVGRSSASFVSPARLNPSAGRARRWGGCVGWPSNRTRDSTGVASRSFSPPAELAYRSLCRPGGLPRGQSTVRAAARGQAAAPAALVLPL